MTTHVLSLARLSVLFIAILLAEPVRAQSATKGAADAGNSVNVGIEGKLIYRYAAELRARPFSAKSPVVIRVASSAPDGPAFLYDLRYIGSRPGRFDLRDALERLDGRSLADAPEAIIEVVGILPQDHGGELISTRGLGLPPLGPYRLGLIILAAMWIVPLFVLITRRAVMRRRAVVPVAPPAGMLTLADQLRPLVEAAIQGRAGVEELAKLERLLIAHWRDRLGLAQLASHDALVKLRQHVTGGEILRNVESWLHRPKGADEPSPDVAAMLEPYRKVEPMDLAVSARSQPQTNSPPARATTVMGGPA